MPKQCIYVNPRTGRAFCVNGCKYGGEPPPSKKYYVSGKSRHMKLPRSVDLREFMTPVEDQAKTSSCTANALAGAYEFLIMKNIGRHIDVSRLFIYYNARIKGGADPNDLQDEGSSTRDAIKALIELGCCKEDMFPFTDDNLNRKPPQRCYEEAIKYRIEENTELHGSLDEMKACLAEGYPFVFGMKIWDTFSDAETNNGCVPLPDFENEDDIIGGHAMVTVGYSDRSQCFIVRNSWGEKWGDQGYCYIPYKYLCNTKYCYNRFCVVSITKNPAHGECHNVPSRYDWRQCKNNPFCFPSNYVNHYFEGEWFWKPDDPYDYYHPNGQNPSTAIVLPNNYSSLTHILWVDQDMTEFTQMMKYFGDDPRIRIDSQKTFIQTIDYLLQNMFKIKFHLHSTIFQIICRIYHASDYSSILNLLIFLNIYQLQNVSIVVIAGDKLSALNQFEREAALMGMRGWKSRIYVTDNSSDLITKIKTSLIYKQVSH